MAVTISTHLGSKLSRAHNIRDPKIAEHETHIDPNGEHEIWQDEPEIKAYDRIFGQAVEDYNSRQIRSDRKIKSYHAQVSQDTKKHTAYEMIVSVGSRDNPVSDDVGKAILKEFYDSWQERNPHLDLIGAYYHADEEGVPHLHLDFVPVADGYKRGLSVQNSLSRALEEQGIGRDPAKRENTVQIAWEHQENQALESICNEHGIEIEHPQAGQKHVEHMETELYKMSQELATKDRQLEQVTADYDKLQAQANTALKVIYAVADGQVKAEDILNPQQVQKSPFMKDTVTDIHLRGDEADQAVKQVKDMQANTYTVKQISQAVRTLQKAEFEATPTGQIQAQIEQAEHDRDIARQEASEASQRASEASKERDKALDENKSLKRQNQDVNKRLSRLQSIISYLPQGVWEKAEKAFNRVRNRDLER